MQLIVEELKRVLVKLLRSQVFLRQVKNFESLHAGFIWKRYNFSRSARGAQLMNLFQILWWKSSLKQLVSSVFGVAFIRLVVF